MTANLANYFVSSLGQMREENNAGVFVLIRVLAPSVSYNRTMAPHKTAWTPIVKAPVQR